MSPHTLDAEKLDETKSAAQKSSGMEKPIPNQSFLARHKEKIFAAVLWVSILVAFIGYAIGNGLGIFEALKSVTVQLVDLMTNSAWGPLIFLLAYATRPIFLFSAGLLSVAGGFLFGPLWGIIYTVIASNLSAMVAYMIGRFFGSNLLDDDASAGIIQNYADRMRENSFFTILTMRLAFLPYDLVNYIAAFLNIDWKPFLLATALGSLPGTIAFSLFGASLTEFDGSTPEFDFRILAVGVGIFIISLVISRFFKQREENKTKSAAGDIAK